MNILLVCNYKPGVGGISGQVEILQRKLRSEGHTADIFSTKASVLKRLLLLRKLRKVARKYDVLHIHCCSGWGFLPAVVGVTVGRRLKKRVVLTYHGGGGERFFDKHACLVKHFLMRTDTNIVLSGFLAKIFDRYQLPYTIIPNIIELNDSHYRKRTSIQPNLICTRAHETLYNIPCALHAFQKVQTQLPNATLTLVGDGSEHENLIKLVQEINLNNVTFTGRVDNQEIYRHLDKADIFISTPTVDNMPVSLLEAMNAGLLVISSRVGGVPYMIQDGKSGLLFESGNHDELAEKIFWAIENNTMALAMTPTAHQEIMQYHWENIKEKIHKAYGILT